MKKKLLPLLLCIAMALLPTVALADEAPAATSVIVGGKTLDGTDGKTYATTDANGVVTLGGNEQSYNIKFQNGALTLNGATIAGVTQVYYGPFTSNHAIYAAGALELVLEGVNNVYTTASAPGVADQCPKAGICVFYSGAPNNGSLIIRGTGSLNASASDNGDKTQEGIDVFGTLTIESGTITAEGKSTDDNSYGVFATKAFVMNGGTLTATGGDVTGNFSFGISSNETVTINGGTVTATGGTAAMSSYGIRTGVENGIIINPSAAGEVTVSAEATNATGTYRAFNLAPGIGTGVYNWKTDKNAANPTFSLNTPYTYENSHTYTALTLGKTVGENKSQLDGVTYGKVNGGWVTDITTTGLDLTTPPAVATTYAAGSGTVVWDPAATPATLTLNGATVSVTSSGITATRAFTLPSLTGGVNVEFNGNNSISADNNTEAAAFRCLGDATLNLTSGSTTILTAGNAYTHSAYGISGDANITIAGNGTLTIDVPKDGERAVRALSNVNLTGGTLSFNAPISGNVTLGGVSVLGTDTLDLHDAASVVKGTPGATNNGTLILKDGTTVGQIQALGLTGTGMVVVNGRYYKNDGTLIPSLNRPLLFNLDEGTNQGQGNWNSNATLEQDGYTFAGNAQDGYTLTLGNLIVVVNNSWSEPAIKLPDDGPVSVVLADGTVTRINNNNNKPAMEFPDGAYACTISGGGTLHAEVGGGSVITAANLTLDGMGIISPAGAAFTNGKIMRNGADVTAVTIGPAYIITVRANDTAYGSVAGGGMYNKNAAVTLRATANGGYHFVRWTEGGSEVSTDNPYNFTADADRTLIGVFEVNAPSPVPAALHIITHPASANVAAGNSVEFTVVASDGVPPYTYQWQQKLPSAGWAAISAAQADTYQLASVQTTRNGAQYRCIVSDSASPSASVTSNEATLTVSAAPVPPAPVAPTPTPAPGGSGFPMAGSGYAGNTYQGGVAANAQGALVCTVQADCKKLASVVVDGVQLTKDKDYTVQCGSTIVTLTQSYLATLKDGAHTLRVQFTDGRYEDAFTTPLALSAVTAVPDVPATGGAPWHALLLAGLRRRA